MDEESAELQRLGLENEALRLRVADLEARRSAQRDAQASKDTADLVDRNRMEAALRDSEEKYRQIVERANDGVVMLDARSIVFANPAYARMSGYTGAELVGMDLLRLVPRQEHEIIADRLQRRLAGEQVPNNYESATLCKDGTILPIEVNASVVRYHDKPHDLVFVRDITERKRADEERLFFTNVFKNMMEGVYLIRLADGTIVDTNAKFDEMFGYAPGEMVGKHVSIVNAPTQSSPEETAAAIMAALHEKGVWFGEIQNARKDGSVFWCEAVVATYVHPRHGDVLVSIHRDITERKHLEEQLARHRDQLEGTVAERTRQLAEAKELAEAASRTKGLFLANMSHEIRTPMNAIFGLAHLLGQTPLDSSQQDYLEKIKTSSRALLDIINDILDYSKIESGKLELDCTTIDFEEMLCNLAVMVNASLQDKDIEILFDRAPTTPRLVRGDAPRLQQVLLNLLGNAAKFTMQGNVVLTIAADTDLPGDHPDRHRLRFSVKDTGIGLTPEQQTRLFQAFSQADASTTRRFGGTGLGLAISSRIVSLMGGKLEVTSALGQGSEFFFALEFEQVEPVEAHPQDAKIPKELDVLVVDDSPLGLAVTTGACRSLGWNVVCASTPQEALQCAAETACDVALIDWKLPGMDGLELGREIQETAPHCLVVLTVTAFENARWRSQGQDPKAFRPLLQPFTRSQVLETVALGLVTAGTAMPASGRARPQTSLAGKRILLVEDNEMNQMVARTILEQAGATVVVASNGAQALRKLSKEIHLVLLDVQMPEMDGYEATRAIREMREYAGLPIVAMTANAFESDREACLAAGMNDFIPKPLDARHMLSTIARYLDDVDLATAPGNGMGEGHVGILDSATAIARMGDPGIYVDALSLYAKTTPEARFALLDKPLRMNEWEVSGRAAHTLKSVAAMIGAQRLATLTAELEAACAERKSVAQALLPDIKQELTTVAEAVKAYLS